MKLNSWSVLAGALILVNVGTAFGGTNTWTEVGPLAADVKVRFSDADTGVCPRWRQPLEKHQRWSVLGVTGVA